MTPLQTQQSLDITFDDSGAFDVNSELLAFTNLDDSIIISAPPLTNQSSHDEAQFHSNLQMLRNADMVVYAVSTLGLVRRRCDDVYEDTVR
jgi:hypothetical protein